MNTQNYSIKVEVKDVDPCVIKCDLCSEPTDGTIAVFVGKQFKDSDGECGEGSEQTICQPCAKAWHSALNKYFSKKKRSKRSI
jgi:hypothetical protein